jgi:glycosyltransferase involved in cell wall biosynthesis
MVTLVRSPGGGGHVKCWERLTEAAAATPNLVDLTVYFLGPTERTTELGSNARFVTLPPRLGTGRFDRRARGPGATDLAPFHAGLARSLPRHHVWHVTDTFAFGSTARILARRSGRPLAGSVHTDLPRFTRVYSRQVAAALLGKRGVARVLLDAVPLERWVERLARKRVDTLLRSCRHVLVSNDHDHDEVARLIPADRIGRLRRGIDKELFHPRRANRRRLTHRYGVPADVPVILFAGRIDGSKRALTVARAVRRLVDRGVPCHLFMAGHGGDTEEVRGLLGPAVTLPGHLPQRELAWVYASADVFAFPSETETVGNVVAEAMAAGLPVVLPRGANTAQWLARPGRDGLLVGDRSTSAWATALETLVRDGAACAAMGRRARGTVERLLPTWSDVLIEDLVPVWRMLMDPAHPGAGPVGPFQDVGIPAA